MSPRWLFALLLACSGPPAAPEPAPVSAPEPVVAPEPVTGAEVTPPEPVAVAVEPSEASKVPAEPSAGEPSRELVVEARLVDRPRAPGCGVLHVVLVMRYEVVRVVSGDYPHSELYVAHSCPEMGAGRCKESPGERIKGFKMGDVHHLELYQGRGSGSLMDMYTDKSLPRYRTRCASSLPPK